MFYKKNLQVNQNIRESFDFQKNHSFLLKELSTKTVESISTASSSNESFQRDDVEVECDDNRYIYILSKTLMSNSLK